MYCGHFLAGMDRGPWLGAADRRPARPAYPSRSHPGDERLDGSKLPPAGVAFCRTTSQLRELIQGHASQEIAIEMIRAGTPLE